MTIASDSHQYFSPDANESPQHMLAKDRLAHIFREMGMDVELEVPIETDSDKTYYCDVLVSFSYFGFRFKLDLEVEDFDHTKHDFDDAENKVKELARHSIRTIWFKSSSLTGRRAAAASEILARILNDMPDGQERNPRFNI